MGQGVSKIVVNNIVDEIDNLPVTKEQLMLLKKVLYAIYNAKLFGVDDLKELYEVGFNDKDFYDLLSYGVDFMAKSKMIEIYLSPKEE
ncbi:MAG: hypothetical protein GXO30_01710 [Epsilonproteobacteria bacterium]|nr:hypothetical protein [Campylobacterota bacterium]